MNIDNLSQIRKCIEVTCISIKIEGNMNTDYLKRFESVKNEMSLQNIDALLISDPYSIFYLTGIFNEPYERFYALYIENDKNILFANRLFSVPIIDFEKTKQPYFETIWYADSDDVIKIISKNIINISVLGVDKILAAKFLIPLQKVNNKLKFELGSVCVDNARACKDKAEIEFMKESSRINDVVIQKAFDFIKPDITEKEVAEYINAQFLNEGADGPSFETIVSFGNNAANPHHSPDNTKLKEGDCILIDMGCIKNHYCSDMTRTNFYKSADEKSLQIHEIVRKANEKAESIIKPGVKFSDIDAAARNIITEAGYGEYFTHRLGHFCGQTDHEQGDVSSSNNEVTKPGMIFSIEPGIYLPKDDSSKNPTGLGVRIEDLVLVTQSGCEILNHVDKKYKII